MIFFWFDLGQKKSLKASYCRMMLLMIWNVIICLKEILISYGRSTVVPMSAVAPAVTTISVLVAGLNGESGVIVMV